MKQKFAGPDLSFSGLGTMHVYTINPKKRTGPPLSKSWYLYTTYAQNVRSILLSSRILTQFICRAKGPKMNIVHLKEYFSKVSGMGDQENNGIWIHTHLGLYHRKCSYWIKIKELFPPYCTKQRKFHRCGLTRWSCHLETQVIASITSFLVFYLFYLFLYLFVLLFCYMDWISSILFWRILSSKKTGWLLDIHHRFSATLQIQITFKKSAISKSFCH